jgi:hypothetical protein
MIFVNDIKRLAATRSVTAHYGQQHAQLLLCGFVQLKVFA